MRISDIDKKLDMILLLKVRQNTELFDTTANLDIKFPTYIYGVDGKVWISTYVPKGLGGNNIKLLLNKFKAVEKDNSYVIDSRINNVNDLAIIQKLIELPSVVIGRSDMSKGFLNLYIRFHSSQMDEVSDLLAQYTADTENSRVELLGPSPGIMKVIDIINSEYPISLVTFEYSPEKEDQALAALSNELGIIAEFKNSSTNDGTLSAILYSDHKIANSIPGLTPISADDNIYEVGIKSTFLSKVRVKANDSHIMRLRYFIRIHDGKIQQSVFIPTASVYEYSSFLYEFAREKDHGLVIRYIMPYTSAVWEFI
jgi:hypothetical protein